MMAADSERFDGLFLNVAQQAGGIEQLFDAFFGFLHRKTDYYVGCKTKMEAEKALFASFNKYWDMAQEKKDKEKKRNEEMDATSVARRLAQERKDKEEYEKRTKAKSEPAPMIEEVDDDVPVGVVKSETQKKEKLLEDNPEKDNLDAEKPAKKEDDGPAPEGNGGVSSKYTWTQTLQTADCMVPIKPGSKSKDIGVDIKAGALKVYYKSDKSNPILDGPLYSKVKPEDCTWLLVDNKIIHISLEKVDQMKWWDNIIIGMDGDIDTKKIIPENSKLSDLDGETRQTVEKMMYDQRQKQMGLPTADQKKQHDLLDSFKKQHPEMDFSKCKVNYGGEGGGGMGNFDASGKLN